MIDIHCHILPALDDGPLDIEGSLAMARVAAEDGIRVIVATPHITGDRLGVTPEVIRERVRELQSAIDIAGIPIGVLPGAEHELSDRLSERVRQGQAMTIADGGRYILVEMPFTGGQMLLVEHAVFALQLAGLTAVIAHPERSSAATGRQSDMLRRLSQRGCLLQVNAGSLLGWEGRRIRDAARRLLRAGLVDVLATDAHNLRDRRPALSPCARYVGRFAGAGAFEELTQDLPTRLIAAR
jgi:protein-tyrosine phosphatase